MKRVLRHQNRKKEKKMRETARSQYGLINEELREMISMSFGLCWHGKLFLHSPETGEKDHENVNTFRSIFHVGILV